MMTEKSDKEIAAELTIAMINHNAGLKLGNGANKMPILKADFVANQFAYILAAVKGDINVLSEPKK
ncbi:hypothetical protein [Paucilactobacillus kaifaensis]|jgi:hypothetical protein|uniref:hypothetical protein n=1 Tax=Paucilactobacillus kaifaensis TaxID=2559921 RepID=UPI0010F6DAA8|nr:hypothetical protein [Paucilactobacillus kaifaensis]